MKRIERLGMTMALAAALCTALAPGAMALTATTTANASVTVDTTFTITLDTSTIAYGTIAPGATGVGSVIATCKTNNGAVWYLKAKYDAAEAGTTLKFKSSGGAGTNVTVYTAFTTLDQTTYTSTAGEGNNLPGGNAITVDHELTVATNASPGARAWVVTYTFTETV